MEERKAAVDPLPLVPAIWIEGILFCGLSREARRFDILARPNFIPNFCSP
jgi:hypothetical protein